MGIFLSQLPPAELARLKAELAETLLANFCYPRFFDYRTNTLRMRPVDRAKRQEVWLFLSSFDFNAWNRLDLLSTEFQRQVERLFIQFIQRNRTFFGEQGRKRMADVRMLINSSSTSVVEGLRKHLTNRQAANPPFGSPRPVISWAAANITGQGELQWEQIAASTLLLQQQLQEVRGEIKAAAANDGRAAPPTSAAAPSASPLAASGAGAVPPKRSPRNRTTVNGGGDAAHAAGVEARRAPAPPGEVLHVPAPKTMDTLPEPVASTPRFGPAAIPTPPVPTTPSDSKAEHLTLPKDTPPQAEPVPGNSAQPASQRSSGQAASPAAIHPRELSKPAPVSPVEVPAPRFATTAVLVSDEDIVIFEQMRHQLVVWLRIEAVRSGIDVSSQSPSQLLDLLRQQDGFDETRLQIVSTLLNLSDQVIANRHASLIDYKQAMMFYLMHTRRLG